ncbi:MAG: hypothetical protein HY298_19055 [Verrucomicrobia bacterium]|nr:hypothetical protein [Verrucomicrobiota bacterium]
MSKLTARGSTFVRRLTCTHSIGIICFSLPISCAVIVGAGCAAYQPSPQAIESRQTGVTKPDARAQVNDTPELDFDVLYSDSFSSHYPLRSERAFDLGEYELEAPVVVWGDSHRRKTTVFRTRGDKYGYENQKCIIRIEGRGLDQPRELSITDFRTVTVSWITAKLILIELDIGHIAGVDAIYDVEKDSWIYQESVSYGPKR